MVLRHDRGCACACVCVCVFASVYDARVRINGPKPERPPATYIPHLLAGPLPRFCPSDHHLHQMLWVNLIMDSLASLALATEAPTGADKEREEAEKGGVRGRVTVVRDRPTGLA